MRKRLKLNADEEFPMKEDYCMREISKINGNESGLKETEKKKRKKKNPVKHAHHKNTPMVVP